MMMMILMTMMMITIMMIIDDDDETDDDVVQHISYFGNETFLVRKSERITYLCLYLTNLRFLLQNVSFDEPFYKPPCVITTASHQYNPLDLLSIPPSENTITEWTEVRRCNAQERAVSNRVEIFCHNFASTLHLIPQTRPLFLKRWIALSTG